MVGVVRFDSGAGLFAPGFPAEEWAGHRGIMVFTGDAGLVLYPHDQGMEPLLAPASLAAVTSRFGPDALGEGPGDRMADAQLDPWRREALGALLDRRACRRFLGAPVEEGLLRLVLAAGLSAPSKSDLQQADVVWVRDPALRAEVTRDCGDWVAALPDEVELLVICGDGRRLRRLSEDDWPNDHFDALFNATGDGALLLGQLVAAAALAGLGACPISVMRNRAAEVSAALSLPERVFPFAGLALGWPLEPQAPVSPRLGLDATLHIDRFDADGQAAAVAAYDTRRGPVGAAPSWSLAKRAQYARAQRRGWGAFLRGKGFRMD